VKRTALLVVAAMALVALPARVSRADDSVALSQSSSLIGEHILMEVRVRAPAGATVELTPGTASWAGVELVGVDSVLQIPDADGVLWLIEARIAPFLPGTVEFAPTVAVVQGSDAVNTSLPPVVLDVVPSLAPDAELVLTPLAPTVEIEGEESPLLKPAIVVGLALGAVLIAGLIWLIGRWMLRRFAKDPAIEATPLIPATLDGAEQILDSDPVGAYRLMSSVVKTELARRYGVRATALTTTELQRRLETGGDRWQARLVGGLLQECDSVIYAGYRPATERRYADLTMAREIVDVAG